MNAQPLSFETPAQFSLHIETLANIKNATPLETVLQYCEENFIDPEDLKPMINQTLKDKLAQNLQDIGLMTKTASLEDMFGD